MTPAAPWYAARIAVKGIWAAAIAAVVIASLGFGVVQTVRLEGLKVGPLSIEGALPKVDRLKGDLANVRKAQKVAKKEAERQRVFWQDHYRNRAQEADLANATETQPRAVDDADRYIAANRVQPCSARGVGERAGAPASDRRAGRGDRSSGLPIVDDRPALPADEHLLPGFVTVTETDVRICSQNTARMLDVASWATTLERESAAASEGQVRE